MNLHETRAKPDRNRRSNGKPIRSSLPTDRRMTTSVQVATVERLKEVGYGELADEEKKLLASNPASAAFAREIARKKVK